MFLIVHTRFPLPQAGEYIVKCLTARRIRARDTVTPTGNKWLDSLVYDAKVTAVYLILENLMDREIRERLGKAKNYLGEKYRLSKIGVFGSYARGDEKPGSDIDILVEFSSTPDLFEFFEIEEYLERVLDRKIDLVREKAIKKQMKDEIMKEVVFL